MTARVQAFPSRTRYYRYSINALAQIVTFTTEKLFDPEAFQSHEFIVRDDRRRKERKLATPLSVRVA